MDSVDLALSASNLFLSSGDRFPIDRRPSNSVISKRAEIDLNNVKYLRKNRKKYY